MSLRVRYNAEDDATEAGLDEAGRGCFWGPIVAGAVIWPSEHLWTTEHRDAHKLIRDSKKIRPKKRKEIAVMIQRLSVSSGTGVVSAEEIDEHGITWANQEAFRRALHELTTPPQRLVIDGLIGLPSSASDSSSEHPYEIVTAVDGDATFLSVAAASILAKVKHDDIVEEFCKTHTEAATHYGLSTGMGYGTETHRKGLKEFGPIEGHRRTFIYRWIPEPTAKPLPKSATSTSAAEKTGKTEEKCMIRFT